MLSDIDKEEWKKKIDKYVLVKTQGGAIVFKSKEEVDHYICPSCVERKKEIQILQVLRGRTGEYICPGCDKRFPVDPPIPPPGMRVISRGIV